MNENVLLIVVILVVMVLAWMSLKYAVWHEKKHQKDMDDLRQQISQWPHEKLVYIWGEYDAICSIRDAGVSPMYFEMLELLEDECRKRGFK